MNDLTRYNRAAVAAAYRRLADAATAAAAVYGDPDRTGPDERRARDTVTGRVTSVRHALTLLAAARTGERRELDRRTA